MSAPRPRRRETALALVRAALTVVVLVVVYYALPLARRPEAATIAVLVVGLVVLAVVLPWQLRAIVASPHPGLRALETLTLAITLFLLLFAAVYVLASESDPGAFTAPLTRTDALYFTVTVFATVGFGDITAVSEPVRLLVTVQMIGDLLVLGFVLRAVLDAVDRGRRRGIGAEGS